MVMRLWSEDVSDVNRGQKWRTIQAIERILYQSLEIPYREPHDPQKAIRVSGYTEDRNVPDDSELPDHKIDGLYIQAQIPLTYVPFIPEGDDDSPYADGLNVGLDTMTARIGEVLLKEIEALAPGSMRVTNFTPPGEFEDMLAGFGSLTSASVEDWDALANAVNTLIETKYRSLAQFKISFPGQNRHRSA